MSEAIVSFAIQRIHDLLNEEAKFLNGVSGHVEKMKGELMGIKCFLEDADARPRDQKEVEHLVKEIRNAALDAEDVIEIFILKVASRRRRGGAKNIIRRFACILNEARDLHKVGSDITNIQTKVSEFRANLERVGIRTTTEAQGSSSAHERQPQLRRSYQHVPEDTVGLEESVKILAEQLVNEEKQDCRVISICGMGGLGKTTLAKKVYHDRDVRKHFECFAWAYISQQCQPTDVMLEILIELVSPSKEQREELKNLSHKELAEKIHQVQQQKRCLVILDDIWHVNDWTNLSSAFPLNEAASKILLTTRKKNVAQHVDLQGFFYEPECLTKEKSWELFLKKAFPRKDGTVPNIDPDKEKLGREMVEKCGNLPLAIVLLGGLLVRKETLHDWETVRRNVLSNLMRDQDDERRLQEVINLSYYDLPYQLKPCFLYLGHFREDSEIPIKKLVRLWVAEGLISQTPKDEGLKLEEIARQNMDQLMERCMVQLGVRGRSGRAKTCRLHDLMRDLCLQKAREEDFLQIIHVGKENREMGSGRMRRCAIYLDQDVDECAPLARNQQEPPRLRSLLLFVAKGWFPETLPEKVNKFMFHGFKLLRVLDLERFCFDGKLPTAIGNLIHLRYFSIKCARSLRSSFKIPSSIGNLECLQTLDLRIQNYDTVNVKIPNVIWKMKRLRHLYLPFWTCKLRLDSLRDLETLQNLNAKAFSSSHLTKLSSLQKLGMYRAQSEDLEVILGRPSGILDSLQSLSLQIESAIEDSHVTQIFNCRLLKNLFLQGNMRKLPDQFAPDLTKLTLVDSNLHQDPMTILERLDNLMILRLLRDAYLGVEMVCTEKGFPILKSLTIAAIPNLEEWKVDEGAMPNLRHLQIVNCKKLKMVPEGLSFISSLEKMNIHQPR